MNRRHDRLELSRCRRPCKSPPEVGAPCVRTRGWLVGRSRGRSDDRCAHPKSPLSHRIAARTQNLHSLTESLRARKISTLSVNRCEHPKSPLPYRIAARAQNLHSLNESLRAPKISTPSRNRCAHAKSPLSHRIVARTQNLHSLTESMRAPEISTSSRNRSRPRA